MAHERTKDVFRNVSGFSLTVPELRAALDSQENARVVSDLPL